MYTKEGQQLFKEVNSLFKNTPFHVSDDSKQYDYDTINISLYVRDGAAGLMNIFKANLAQIYKNLIKTVKKYKHFGIVDADEEKFYDGFEDSIRFFQIYEKDNGDDDDDLSESFNSFAPGQTSLMESFNGFVNR